MPAKVRDLSPFEHRSELEVGAFTVAFGVGLTEATGATTCTAFFVVVEVPWSLDEITLKSIFVKFLIFVIGIKKVAASPEIFPTSLLEVE